MPNKELNGSDKNAPDSTVAVTITTTQSYTSHVSSPANAKPFDSDTVVALSLNENFRYVWNDKKAGHGVMVTTPSGEKEVLQFSFPPAIGTNVPEIRPLQNFHELRPYAVGQYQGPIRYGAETPKGTRMYGRRFIDAKTNVNKHEENIEIVYFSPADKNGKVYWGSIKEHAIFSDLDDRPDEDKQEFAAELAEIEPSFKGGRELVVEPSSVKIRDKMKSRGISQNEKMGESARDAYENFLNKYWDELTPKLRYILKRAASAPLRKGFASHYRPEWLHGEGFSLTPMSIDPQRKDNLGAAPKWANTDMMVLERIVKWYALNQPHAFAKIKPVFEMLLDSELIKRIKFEVTIEDKNRWIKFLQDINPFKESPLVAQSSDLVQATGITYYLLNDIAPASRQKIKPITPINTQLTASFQIDTIAKPFSIKPTEGNENTMITSKNVSAEVKSQSPTHLKYQQSVVKIMTTSQDYDVDRPWVGTDFDACTGSGFVIEKAGVKYVMTNAHVVQNHTMLRVRIANSEKEYDATCKSVSYQADLAILEVKSAKFQELAEPVKVSDKMIRLNDELLIVGFPMGGTQVSVATGVASRIEVDTYSISGEEMLQVQTDGAVIPGNSGGPIFVDDEVVGVAFQGYDMQGLGYMIPGPHVTHFLNEVFSEMGYLGYPVLPIDTQSLDNKNLRQFYGMQKHQTGCRINRIDRLSDAYNKLKVDDIILKIDNLAVSNMGKVDVPDVGNCIDIVHITHSKYLGESVNLQILRRNPINQQPEIHDINVVLDNLPNQSKLVGDYVRDRAPTYYFASGICFAPLTKSYLESAGCDFEGTYLEEEGEFLIHISKKLPTDQMVVIVEVLDCPGNRSYRSSTNNIVKEVNGKKINNMHELVTAFEENTADKHVITISSNKKLVVKNMDEQEHKKLLTHYTVPADRSADLPMRKVPSLVSNPVAPTHAETKLPEVKNAVVNEDATQSKLLNKNKMTPGQQHFQDFINDLEERIQNNTFMPDGGDELYNFDESLDDPLATDSDLTEEEDMVKIFDSEEDEEIQEPVKKRPRTQLADSSRIFKQVTPPTTPTQRPVNTIDDEPRRKQPHRNCKRN